MEEQINELKTSFGQGDDDQMDYGLGPALSHDVDGTGLLFNQVKPIDRMEILSSLPPKPEVDRLIAWFFRRQDFPITIPRTYSQMLVSAPLTNVNSSSP